jgi:hypothetical protein
MNQAATAAATKRESAEPLKLLARIGSTTYRMSIRFSDKATETMERSRGVKSAANGFGLPERSRNGHAEIDDSPFQAQS